MQRPLVVDILKPRHILIPRDVGPSGLRLLHMLLEPLVALMDSLHYALYSFSSPTNRIQVNQLPSLQIRISHHAVIEQNATDDNIPQVSERRGIGEHEQILHLKSRPDPHSTINVPPLLSSSLRTDAAVNLRRVGEVLNGRDRHVLHRQSQLVLR